MITIENVEIFGFETSIRGCRNAFNSWSKSDSCWEQIENPQTMNTAKFQFHLGEADFELMKKLAAAGNDHGKFMRMINVTCDIIAPLYWWKEFDTYKVGTVANSCSTMHKIADKEFTLDDFSCEHLWGERDALDVSEPIGALNLMIDVLNANREEYLHTKNKLFWWQMIQLLPCSYNQRRTVQLNYAVLKNMYHARRAHKLNEWHDFCHWIEELPYSELIIGEKENERE